MKLLVLGIFVVSICYADPVVKETENRILFKYAGNEDTIFAIKTLHKSGKLNIKYSGAANSQTQMDSISDLNRRRRYSLFGALDDSLIEMLKHDGIDEKERRAYHVELANRNPIYIDRTTSAGEVNRLLKMQDSFDWSAIKRTLYKKYIRRNSTGKSNVISNDAYLELMLNKHELFELSKDSSVALIAEKGEPSVSSTPNGVFFPFQSLTESAANPFIFLSSFGNGINNATLESGLRVGAVSCMESQHRPVYYEPASGTNWELAHSEACYYISAIGAPSANHYHFNEWEFANITSKISTYGIRSISASHSYPNLTNHPTGSEARAIDRLAFSYPYPVVSLPTDNHGYNEVPWNTSYNALIVGNVRHKNEFTFDLPPTLPTQTKNPNGIYGGVSDRELPHIVAPGYSPDSAYVFGNPCFQLADGNGNLITWGPYGGTSFSAPVANAMATNVLSADNRFLGWPEKVRATIILTSENVSDGYWGTGDQKDGNGTISGSSAVFFAKNHSEYGPNGTASTNNIYAQRLDASEFGTPKQFKILAPPNLPSGRHLRIVLLWDSSPSSSSAQNELSDLDLYGSFNSGFMYSSLSWNSSVEVIDIPNTDISPNGQYTVYVNPYLHRASVDGPNYTYYCIAWTWVKDHAN